MNIELYLLSLLRNSGKYILSLADKQSITSLGLVRFMMSKLLSKKYRKWKLLPECIERNEVALTNRINRNEPITVIYFQGGYKLWRLPSSPNPDWAEFFNIAYVLSYLAPIAAAYKPGIKLIYYLHTLLMEKHDNLTTEEIQSYVSTFKELLDNFQQYLPKNITIQLLRDADIYSREEYFLQLEEGRKKAEEQIPTWPKEKWHDFERMAKLNIKWKGKENWEIFGEVEKQEKIRLAALYEQAATQNLPKVMDIVKAPDNILLFTKPSPAFIGIGSTFTSVVKHWVGFGVLEKNKNTLYPRILSPSQYEKIKSLPHDVVDIKFMKNLSNLQSIMVYPERLHFEKIVQVK